MYKLHSYITLIIFISNLSILIFNFRKIYKTTIKTYIKSGFRVYLIAFILLVLNFSILFLFNLISPDFLHWSWLDLISKPAINVNTGIIQNNNYKYLIVIAFLLFIPFLAKIEEEIFRKNIFNTKKRIIASIAFGVVHIIVGIPLYASIVISIFGYILSVIYKNKFVTVLIKEMNPILANAKSINTITAIHSIYNMYVVILLILLSN